MALRGRGTARTSLTTRAYSFGTTACPAIVGGVFLLVIDRLWISTSLWGRGCDRLGQQQTQERHRSNSRQIAEATVITDGNVVLARREDGLIKNDGLHPPVPFGAAQCGM